jgi:hypothetical protein
MVLGPTKGGVMEYVYDYRSLMSDEHAVTVANQWGQDGWRWINPGAWSGRGSGGLVMIFEKAKQ